MEYNLIIFIFLAVLLCLYTRTYNSNSGHLQSYYTPPNVTEQGFVKPEQRLLKIFNSISSASKITLDGVCTKFIYNKNTIDKSVEDRLTIIIKDLINTIQQISKNDYYIKQIENVYAMISSDNNQRYFVDFFIYDVKHFYTIRVISDIVIIDDEIYINYMNLQTGSNPTILNKYDVKFNDTGILFDGNMFKENVDQLFDSFYRQSFNVIGVNKTSLEYTNKDLTEVVSLNRLKNMYFPQTVSVDTIKDYQKKDLSGYIERYLPSDQKNMYSPMFCNKYEGENCVINSTNSTQKEYNEPWQGPGLYDNMRQDKGAYDWLLKKPISNSL